MVGSEEEKVANAVKKVLEETPLVNITIKRNEITRDKIAVQYYLLWNIANSNVLALLAQNKTLIKIKAGENDGAMLTSYNVVRSLVSLPAKKDSTRILPISLNSSE